MPLPIPVLFPLYDEPPVDCDPPDVPCELVSAVEPEFTPESLFFFECGFFFSGVTGADETVGVGSGVAVGVGVSEGELDGTGVAPLVGTAVGTAVVTGTATTEGAGDALAIGVADA